jgi:hypothetical protein
VTQAGQGRDADLSRGALELSRAEPLARLMARAEAGPPLLLSGPPGSGKSSLLRQAAAAWSARGCIAVALDLLGLVSTPERFVVGTLRALPAEGFGPRLAAATEILRLAESGRTQGRQAVEALFDLLATPRTADGRTLVLLLDEATEIRSLAYFPGLRHADELLAQRLRARRAPTVLATAFPSAAAKLWHFEELALGPFGALELAPALARLAPHVDAEALARASAGWARYVRILLEAVRTGLDLRSAWIDAMLPGGRIEQACRATYETLLLRSRGYGASKAVMAAVAEQEGLNLSALVARLGRTPGAVRDYLQWLLSVDALRAPGKRYVYVDALLGTWVRLHGLGRPPQISQVESAFDQLVAAAAADAPPAAEPAPTPPSRPPRPRRDALIEID